MSGCSQVYSECYRGRLLDICEGREGARLKAQDFWPRISLPTFFTPLLSLYFAIIAWMRHLLGKRQSGSQMSASFGGGTRWVGLSTVLA